MNLKTEQIVTILYNLSKSFKRECDVTAFTRTQNSAILQFLSHSVKSLYNFSICMCLNLKNLRGTLRNLLQHTCVPRRTV